MACATLENGGGCAAGQCRTIAFAVTPANLKFGTRSPRSRTARSRTHSARACGQLFVLSMLAATTPRLLLTFVQSTRGAGYQALKGLGP